MSNVAHQSFGLDAYDDDLTPAAGAPQIRRSVDGDTSHIWLSGEFDLAAVQPLLAAIVDEPHYGICRVHTGAVTFIDCAGLHALEQLKTHVHDHGSIFELTDLSSPVSRLLQLVDPTGEMFTQSPQAPPVSTRSQVALHGTRQTSCTIESTGSNGEWIATCDIHHWRGLVHRSRQQAELDLRTHQANANEHDPTG